MIRLYSFARAKTADPRDLALREDVIDLVSAERLRLLVLVSSGEDWDG